MPLRLNGDPQGVVGNWNHDPSFINPPFPPSFVGASGTTYLADSVGLAATDGINGAALTAADRIQICQDATGRFGSGVKYWKFKCAPGDTYPGHSGERTRVYTPWRSNTLWQWEGAAKRLRTPNGPWGNIRYFAISLRLDPSFLQAYNFCNFFEVKMTQAAANGISIGCNQGNLNPAGGSTIPLYTSVLAGPVNYGSGAAPGFDYNFDKPPVLSSLTKNVWYDIIVGVKFEGGGPAGFANTGWVSTWVKLATDSNWTLVNVIVNDFTAPWIQSNGDMDGQWFGTGIYRSATPGNTSIVSIQGPYVADTFADIATGVYAAGGASQPPPTDLPNPLPGRTRIGITSPTEMVARSNDYKIVQKENVGAGNTVEIHEAYAYLEGPTAGGDQDHKLVVYESDGSNPDALAGAGPEVTVSQGDPAGWVDVSPASPIAATPDTGGGIFAGLISGGPGQGKLGSIVATNGLWSNADTYSDGATDPFGTPVVSSTRKTLVLDYVSTADTTAPTLLSASAIGNSIVGVYDEALDPASVPAASAYTVAFNGVNVTVQSVAVNGPQLILTLQGVTVKRTDSVVWSYLAPATGKVRDLAGNNAANFSSQTVIVPALPTSGIVRPVGTRPTGTRPTGTRTTGTRPTGTPAAG